MLTYFFRDTSLRRRLCCVLRIVTTTLNVLWDHFAEGRESECRTCWRDSLAANDGGVVADMLSNSSPRVNEHLPCRNLQTLSILQCNQNKMCRAVLEGRVGIGPWTVIWGSLHRTTEH
ncbi:hypothetical protein NPIL_51811 [Nephila pilipes]|uniref:Uncharacterized protein n=1 Tax=Nephila pilipes TaxID=299642 RepID=A0A8X6JQU8_NEPPI|nr:hypothetical protein NPIL_436041 [Nephila pilipes]GFT79852.1 hypothetical protein NPIL_51811 [Nephila pilipes]